MRRDRVPGHDPARAAKESQDSMREHVAPPVLPLSEVAVQIA
jgi:hypothetical protein